MDDLIRFNEAIDQALAESVNFFSKKVDESRNLLLGMLGHDMRNPLATIQATSSYLSMLNAGGAVTEAADRLMRSGARIKALLDDLLDFNRTNLGLGISINPCPLDLAAVFSDEIDQLRAANPGRSIELQVKGDLRGVWDGFRVQQVLANLVINALKYSTPDTPVFVTIIGEKDEVRFDVKNTGPAIEQSTLNWIFDPLKRAAVDEHQQRNESLGLGLYIARQICKSHGGAFLLRVKNAADSLLPRSIEAQAEDLVRAMQGRARR